MINLYFYHFKPIICALKLIDLFIFEKEIAKME